MGIKRIHHQQRRPGTTGLLAAQIAQWRENVIDYETIVDDRRASLEQTSDDLRAAVRDRDRAAIHLAHLIDRALHSADTSQPAA